MIIKTLKLKSGELIAAKLDYNYTIVDFTEREKYVTLHDPIVYTNFRFVDPETDQLVDTISMAPLNGITDDRAIVIDASSVMFVSEIRPRALERYLRFLDQIDEYNKAGDVTMDDPEDQAAPEAEEPEETVIVQPSSKILH